MKSDLWLKVGKMLKWAGSLFLFLSFVPFSLVQATGGKCDSLVQEIRAMQKAQSQLLDGYSSRSEAFSASLNQHADQLEKVLMTSHQIKKSHIENLRLSARAFQSHEVREAQLIQRFKKATAQLLDQVQACLVQ